MTTTEIKTEINKVLDQAPDHILVEILVLLKEAQLDRFTNPTLTTNFKKILTEDNDLLRKLAQ